MRGVSEAQKAADAQRQAYLDRIQTVVPQLEAVLRGEFADIKDDADVARLADQEPARYVKWQAAMMRLDCARQEQQRAQYEAQQRQETQLKEYLAEQHKQLVERLPEWSDAEKGPKLKSELSSYLRNEGFAEQELGNLADHRLVLVARKAMLYDRAQRERAALAKQVNVPKVQKPGTTTKSNPNAEATQAAFDRLSKTGRVDDAANVFKGLKLFG
jgi:hypothetical protein